MRWIWKLILAVAVNAAGLLACAYWIPGFSLVTNDVKAVLIVGASLTLLNMFLKPVLKLVLGPFILLTLGLGLIIVNAIILFLLDYLSSALTIHTTLALLEATLVFTAVNFVFHLATRNE